MPVNDVLAGIAVADLDSALGWYERLLGRPADAIPMDGLAEWHFADTGSIQLIRDADRAGNALLTLSVDDLREHVAVLEQRGLTPGAIDDTSSERVLFASITDPEGQHDHPGRAAKRRRLSVASPGSRGTATGDHLVSRPGLGLGSSPGDGRALSPHTTSAQGVLRPHLVRRGRVETAPVAGVAAGPASLPV